MAVKAPFRQRKQCRDIESARDQRSLREISSRAKVTSTIPIVANSFAAIDEL